jgi:lysozyme
MGYNMDASTYLKNVEGVEDDVYFDTNGYATIGVGICVDSRVQGAGLRPEEIDFILDNRIKLARIELARVLPWFTPLNDVRQTMVISMYWQTGSILRWPGFCKAMENRDYIEAAKQMLDSKVARDPKLHDRWEKQATMMRTGEWL